MGNRSQNSLLADIDWCYGCRKTVHWKWQVNEQGERTELQECVGNRERRENGCGMTRRVVGRR